MDNNNINNPQQFNGQPQQFNGQPQQQYYGQPQQYKKQVNINVNALIALICSSLGTILSIIGTACTCACSASKTAKIDELTKSPYKTSLIIILAIIGAIIALVGVVFAILALLKDKKNMMAIVALGLGILGFVIGFLPAMVVCGYNCSLNSAYKKFTI